jgi:hypothetical protein
VRRLLVAVVKLDRNILKCCTADYAAKDLFRQINSFRQRQKSVQC